MTKYANSATELRTTLNERGIKENLWSGFQCSTKMGGSHIRDVDSGFGSFQLVITAASSGYNWSFTRKS